MTYSHEPVRMYKAIHKAANVYTKQQIARIGKRLSRVSTPKTDNDLLRHMSLVNMMGEAQRERHLSRRDARVSHIAHMFLKGTPWAMAEDPKLTHDGIPFDDLAVRIQEFAPERDLREVTQSLAGWYDAWTTARS